MNAQKAEINPVCSHHTSAPHSHTESFAVSQLPASRPGPLWSLLCTESRSCTDSSSALATCMLPRWVALWGGPLTGEGGASRET